MAITDESDVGQHVSRRWELPIRLTPFENEHRRRGAQMTEYDGWLLPRSYGDPGHEKSIVHDAVGLLDISEQDKFNVKGQKIEAAVRIVLPSMEKFEVGWGAARTGSAHVYRLTDHEALVLTTPDTGLRLLGPMATAGHCVHLVDLTGSLCGLRLVGPRAPDVLQRLSSLDIAPDRFTHGAIVQGAVARVHALLVRRDDAGLVGYDLYVDRDLGIYLWDTLLAVGAPLGLRPVGREAEKGRD